MGSLWLTTALLLITIIVFPIATYYLDEPPNDLQIYLLKLTSLIALIFAFLTFIIGEATKNFSQVDKIWSLTPFIYAWVITFNSKEGSWINDDDDQLSKQSPRLLLMSVLATVWGLRLTINFCRKGGYSWKFWTGEEDYRWPILRAKPEFQVEEGKWNYKIFFFHLFFICLYQNFLLLSIVLPMIKIAGNAINDKDLLLSDYIFAALFIICVIIEGVADEQMLVFQTEKYRRKNNNEDLSNTIYERGFIQHGLFKYTRHPNYFAEQSFWVIFYLFLVFSTGVWINWSICGCLLYIALFHGSINFGEEISGSKYPEYARYQKEVSRCVPWFSKISDGEEGSEETVKFQH